MALNLKCLNDPIYDGVSIRIRSRKGNYLDPFFFFVENESLVQETGAQLFDLTGTMNLRSIHF